MGPPSRHRRADRGRPRLICGLSRHISRPTVAPGFVRSEILDSWPDGPLHDRYTTRMAEVALDPADVATGVVHVLGLPADVLVPEYAVMSVRQ